MYRRKNTVLTLLLSVIPGLAQLYLGKWKKAVSLLIIAAGAGLAFALSPYYIVRALMVLVYTVTVIPASIEAYQLAKYGHNTIDTGARWYVILLLFCTGFTAVPLLWRSREFSRNAKFIWTAAVTVLAILFFTVLGTFWSELESFLERLV